MRGADRFFLIGPTGAGKTTIGRTLARVLGLSFHDSDRVIEQRTGVTIPLIFEVEGEAGFRVRERNIIHELSNLPDIVLATGGGAILDAANRADLAARGQVIYLHAGIEQQFRRTEHDRHRPLLQTGDRRARLIELMRQRTPLYREIADITIETDAHSAGFVVKDILNCLTLRAQD